MPKRRLRLIHQPDPGIRRAVDALDAVYSSHHRELLQFLDALETELGDTHASNTDASEQIAFIRVGLRCLADAVGELQATVPDVASHHGNSPCRSSSGDAA